MLPDSGHQVVLGLAYYVSDDHYEMEFFFLPKYFKKLPVSYGLGASV